MKENICESYKGLIVRIHIEFLQLNVEKKDKSHNLKVEKELNIHFSKETVLSFLKILAIKLAHNPSCSQGYHWQKTLQQIRVLNK